MIVIAQVTNTSAVALFLAASCRPPPSWSA
jgi:hypothetical protein